MSAARTTPGKRFDEHRGLLLLGVAGASLAQLSGCGGVGGSPMMGQVDTTAPVDPAAGAAPERSLPLVQLDHGKADGSGGRQFALTVQQNTKIAVTM